VKYPGFVGPSYTSQSKIAADDRCVNWFPEKIESGTGQTPYALYPTPGYAHVSTLGDAPGRGLFSVNAFGTTGIFAAVSGQTLYIFGGFYGNPVGTIADDAAHSRVSMVTNGDAGSNQLLISSGLGTHTLYAYSGASLTTLTPQGSVVGFLNGYGLALDTSSSTLQWSALENFTSWDPADVAQRNDAPDKWVTMLVHHKEVWLFGSETTSVYYTPDDPDPNAPALQPIVSVFIQCGIMASESAKVADGSPIWLGKTYNGGASVFRANGYTPERISTFAVEYFLSQLGNHELSSAYADVFQLGGHTFYKLSFPGPNTVPNTTWVYDVTTGFWFEEGEWDGQRYIGLSTWCQSYITPNNWTISRTSGKVFALAVRDGDGVTASIGLEASGNPIRRMRRAPHLASDRKRIIFDRLEVLLEVGLGLSTGIGSDPHLALRWSDDGGQTFGNTITTPAGKLGEFRTLAIFRKLGQARDRVFELTVTDPIPWRLLDAYLELRVGAS
jgi:hypothetical protein